MIIINEFIYAENLLINGFSLPYNKRFKDIFTLAKYYKYLGLDMDSIQINLFEFLNKYDKEFDINTNNKDREIVNKIAYSVYNKNFNFRINNNININRKNYLEIKLITKKQLRNLALLFCILSKLYNSNIIKVQYSDLMKLLKTTSSDRLNKLIKDLEILGVVEEQEFGVFETYFVNDDIFDYEVKEFTYCKNCGVLINHTNNKQKYCENCAREILQEQKNRWKRENWNGRKIENP